MSGGATKGGMRVSSQTVPETRRFQPCLVLTFRQLQMALLFLSFWESLAQESQSVFAATSAQSLRDTSFSP